MSSQCTLHGTSFAYYMLIPFTAFPAIIILSQGDCVVRRRKTISTTFLFVSSILLFLLFSDGSGLLGAAPAKGSGPAGERSFNRGIFYSSGNHVKGIVVAVRDDTGGECGRIGSYTPFSASFSSNMDGRSGGLADEGKSALNRVHTGSGDFQHTSLSEGGFSHYSGGAAALIFLGAGLLLTWVYSPLRYFP